jgi:hypothetical protein
VRQYYYDRHWAPGDIYFACAIAYQLGRPCLEIINIYERDHGQGWGVIAKRLGIKPGSPAFHALKGHVGKGHGKMKGNSGRGGNGNGNGGNHAPVTHGGHSGGPPPKSGGQGSQGGKGKGKDKGGR